MGNKILSIFVKIFAIFVIFSVFFVLCVFFFPEIADKYGNAEWNAKIRDFKEKSLQIAPPHTSL